MRQDSSRDKLSGGFTERWNALKSLSNKIYLGFYKNHGLKASFW